MTPTSSSSAVPAGSPLARTLFEFRCADVHPFGCQTLLSGVTPTELVACAREHGARVHGFTPAFYRPERIAAMVGAASNGAARE